MTEKNAPVVLAVTAAISLILGIYYSRFFLRPGVAWLVVCVEGLSVIRSTWSLVAVLNVFLTIPCGLTQHQINKKAGICDTATRCIRSYWTFHSFSFPSQ
jgi:hypothetical protein